MEDNGETATLADGSELNLGKKLTGTITAVNRNIESEFLELPNLSPGVLLGMDALSKLGLQIFINGINITPKKSSKKNPGCVIEGPTAMTNLKKHEQAGMEKFLTKQLKRLDKIKGLS